MRFAINLPNTGPYADVLAVADLARVAEDSGWEGIFVWDHVTWLRSEPQPVEPLAAAGATWWQESLGPHYGEWDDVIDRVRLGPPR